MVILTEEQAAALEAFCESFDLRTSGAWAQVEEAMRDDFGISDPEGALDDARRVLRGQST